MNKEYAHLTKYYKPPFDLRFSPQKKRKTSEILTYGPRHHDVCYVCVSYEYTLEDITPLFYTRHTNDYTCMIVEPALIT